MESYVIIIIMNKNNIHMDDHPKSNVELKKQIADGDIKWNHLYDI